MRITLALVLGLFLSACHSSSHHSTKAKGEALPSGSPTISATPNPVVSEGELGSTTVTWTTGSSESGQVYVSTNGGEEHLFGSGTTGSESPKWIKTGAKYEFRLYQGTDHSKQLAAVTVTHPKP